MPKAGPGGRLRICLQTEGSSGQFEENTRQFTAVASGIHIAAVSLWTLCIMSYLLTYLLDSVMYFRQTFVHAVHALYVRYCLPHILIRRRP